MLLSLFGEIALAVIGGLYVLDCWFDWFIDLMALMKNDDEKDEKQELSENIKRMYS